MISYHPAINHHQTPAFFTSPSLHQLRQGFQVAIDLIELRPNCSLWAVCVVLKWLVKLIINHFFSFHHISPVHVADQMNFEPRPSYPTENRDWIMPATRACCARRGFRKREGSSHQVVCGQPQPLSEHGLKKHLVPRQDLINPAMSIHRSIHDPSTHSSIHLFSQSGVNPSLDPASSVKHHPSNIIEPRIHPLITAFLLAATY